MMIMRKTIFLIFAVLFSFAALAHNVEIDATTRVVESIKSEEEIDYAAKVAGEKYEILKKFQRR